MFGLFPGRAGKPTDGAAQAPVRTTSATDRSGPLPKAPSPAEPSRRTWISCSRPAPVQLRAAVHCQSRRERTRGLCCWPAPAAVAAGGFDLGTMLDFHYELTVNGEALSPEEIDLLAEAKRGLVRIRGPFRGRPRRRMVATAKPRRARTGIPTSARPRCREGPPIAPVGRSAWQYARSQRRNAER